MKNTKQTSLALAEHDRTESVSVECLGLTFANEEARRAYFTDRLREKLQDPAFCGIDGFTSELSTTSSRFLTSEQTGANALRLMRDGDMPFQTIRQVILNFSVTSVSLCFKKLRAIPDSNFIDSKDKNTEAQRTQSSRVRSIERQILWQN